MSATQVQRWRVKLNTATDRYHVCRGTEFLTSGTGFPRSFSTLDSARDAAAKANAKAKTNAKAGV